MSKERTDSSQPWRRRRRKPRLGNCPGCGKVRFRDPREAKDQLRRSTARRRQQLRCYACPTCHGWHIARLLGPRVAGPSAPETPPAFPQPWLVIAAAAPAPPAGGTG